MKHKIILFGKNGMLGNYIYKYFNTIENYNIIAFNRNDIDIRKISFDFLSSFLDNYVDNINNTTIINAIGLILPVKNTNPLDNLIINSVFPNLLSIYCKYKNIHYIQPSTDCVYDGKNIGNYTEDIEPTETNIYGLTKMIGEPKYGTIIRVSIIGEEIYHKYSLIEWVKSNKNKKINGFTNHLWNGITCLEYCHVIKKIIDEKLFWNGIRHIYSNTITKYELITYINKYFNLNINVEPLETQICINKTLKSNYVLPFIIKSLDAQIEELANSSKYYI